jgi:hypothetical protein
MLDGERWRCGRREASERRRWLLKPQQMWRNSAAAPPRPNFARGGARRRHNEAHDALAPQTLSAPLMRP